MNDAVAPSAAQFEAGAAKHFGFLTEHLGFAFCRPPASLPQQFSVCFRKPSVLVAVVGYSYGFALDVEFYEPQPDGSLGEDVPLSLLMRLRAPDLLAPRFGGDRGQLEYMRFAAAALPRCAEDVLAGNFSVVAEIRSLRQQLQAESLAADQARQLARAHARASDAFRKGAFHQTVALLEPFEPSLSHAQSKMLALARRRM